MQNVVAAARSLVSVYRDKYPELLHKKDRGKSASMQLQAGGAEAPRPGVYGVSKVSTGVAGTWARQRAHRQPAHPLHARAPALAPACLFAEPPPARS